MLTHCKLSFTYSKSSQEESIVNFSQESSHLVTSCVLLESALDLIKPEGTSILSFCLWGVYQVECQPPPVCVQAEERNTLLRNVALHNKYSFGCVMLWMSMRWLEWQNIIDFLSFHRSVLTECCWFGGLFLLPHPHINTHWIHSAKTSSLLCLSFTVFHLPDDSSDFVFTLLSLMSDRLPYSPPSGVLKQAQIRRTKSLFRLQPKKSSSDLDSSDPCFALSVLPSLLLSVRALIDSQVNAQQLTVTFPNRGIKTQALMECQMPTAQAAGREGWKTAINHVRWGSRSAGGECMS